MKILRCCRADGTSRNGFIWPELGPVEDPYWNPEPKCGGGLHGWARGEGNDAVWAHRDNDLWLVIEVAKEDLVYLDRKVKFRKGVVEYRGDVRTATDLILLAHPGAACNRATLTGGDWATLTGGYGATLTGGNRATLTGGDYATLTGGDGATLTGGYRATLTGGDGATLIFRTPVGVKVGVVGQNGLLPGKPYTAQDLPIFQPL